MAGDFIYWRIPASKQKAEISEHAIGARTDQPLYRRQHKTLTPDAFHAMQKAMALKQGIRPASEFFKPPRAPEMRREGRSRGQ